MMKTTKTTISILLMLFAIPIYSFGSGNMSQLKGLFKLEPVTNGAQELFLYKENGLSVYFSQNQISYVTQSVKDNDIVLGNRIDLLHEGSNKNSIIESGSLQNIHATISVNGHLYKVFSTDEIVFSDLYENVSLKYFINNEGKLTYHYLLDKNAQLSDIKVKYEGAENLSITEDGQLKLGNQAGLLTTSQPVTFEGDFEKEVKSNYSINSDNSVSYNIKNFSAAKSYVIDPIISYTTYFGGTGSDIAENAYIDEVDASVYAVGFTLSNDFPITPGAYQSTIDAKQDVAIFKFDSLGTRVWATYYGGTEEDEGYAITVARNSGKVFVSGFSLSGDLPGVDNNKAGNADAFIAVFNDDGTFVNSRFIGGDGRDVGLDLVAIGDTAYLTGITASLNFPNTLASIYGGSEDVFITAINGTAGIIWSRYFGGVSSERGAAIATDSQNNLIIVGETESANFPTLLPSQATKNGIEDAFIARFTNQGVLELSTFYGGDSTDVFNAVTVGPNDDMYVTGRTNSSNLFFPSTGVTFQDTFAGGLHDMVIVKFNSAGVPQWSTYYGGSLDDHGNAISINTSSSVIITGRTNSSDFPIDSANAVQMTKGTSFDSYILQFDSIGNRLYSSFLGGNDEDYGKYIDYEPNQSTYVLVGNSKSTDLPVSSIAFQPANAGDNDFFIYTNCSLIPNNMITAGGIGSDDTLRVCQDEAGISFFNLIGSTPLGGSGFYSYQYQVSNDSTNGFVNLPGATAKNYALDTAQLIPDAINSFRRIVSDGVCEDTSNIVYVRLLDSPEVDFSFDTLCVGNPIQFVNQTKIQGRDTIRTIVYTFGDGTSSTLENPIKEYAAKGDYTVGLTVTLSNGCYNLNGFTKTVPVKDGPVADFTFDTQCKNYNVAFTNTTSGLSTTQVSWDFGDGSTSTVENPTNTYNDIGSYQVRLAVESGNGCRDTVIKAVGVDTSIVADFSFTNNTCQDSVITFVDESQSFSGSTDYFWDFGDQTTSTEASPTKTYTTSGVYDVKLVVTALSGCIDSITKSVTIGIPPVADFSTFQNCVGQASQFTDETNSSTGNIVQWIYEFGDGNSSTDQNPTNVYTAAGTYTATLTVITEFGCISTVSKQITIADKPVVEAGNNVTIFEGTSIQLNATSSTAGSYSWTPINGLNPPTIATPVASPSTTTLYTVRVTTADGCFGEDSLTVTVDPSFFIPTAFTPNGDGDNDEFIIAGISKFPNHSVTILNRWGSRLYTVQSNYGSLPWDGTFDGEVLPMGAYFYVIDLGDGSEIFKGTISILR